MAPSWNSTGSSSVCLTPACLHASSEILWSLAPNWKNMDPCTEFDQSEYKSRVPSSPST